MYKFFWVTLILGLWDRILTKSTWIFGVKAQKQPPFQARNRSLRNLYTALKVITENECFINHVIAWLNIFFDQSLQSIRFLIIFNFIHNLPDQINAQAAYLFFFYMSLDLGDFPSPLVLELIFHLSWQSTSISL